MKRTTEEVLRAEVDRATKEVERAQEKVDVAKEKAADAAETVDVAVERAEEAVARLARAKAALEAYLPGEVATLVDQAKERARTTGKHDPTEVAETSVADG